MAIHPLACDLPPSPSLSPEDIMASRRPTSSPLPIFFQLDDDAPLPMDQDFDSSIAFPTPYPQQRAFSVSEVPQFEPPHRPNHRHSNGYPGRRHNMFGPYVMLQTLGEGEFGKVKLAIHSETGQEVAIKLIRRQSIGSSSSRLNKVHREISVLKVLHHPYIVKLYDVVETEKYIGIILECASGGELFEYILARRYLKEKDAKRLFAQLISGVRYMHEKHIVHRDLKLENLLLDRHRNVIITDFGFANQFAAAKDDLMATSCGSPCYAAPELVVSDGLYVGSAVDIWSCGVILYAMLCGYLPFDDDPANPDGENINLLYRYILNTPLMFPSHIGSDARDLLRIMLVPDPRKRCSIEDIMKHRWLKDYRDLFNTTLDQHEADTMDAVERATPVTNRTDASSLDEKTQEEDSVQVVPSNETQVQALVISDDMMHVSGISLDDHHVPSSPESNYTDAMEIQENSVHHQQPILSDKIDTPVSVYQTPLDGVETTSQEKTLVMDTPPPSIDTPTPAPIEKELPDVIPSSSSDIAMKDPEQQSNTQQHSDSRRASAIPTSILQSRFLSSMQRSQSAGVPDTTTKSTTPPNNDSSRTVSFIMQPKPDTPMSARSAGAKPSSQASSSLFARGTRRKALSLLTRPTSDLDDDMTPAPRARRESSVRPAGTSQTVRLVVNGAPKGPSEQATKWGAVTLVPSLSERPGALDQKPKSKGFMEWFRKKTHVTPVERNPGSKNDEINFDRPPLTPQPPGMNKQQPKSISKNELQLAADAKLKVYNGVVDQQALTSRPPFEVFVEVKQCLTNMGLVVKVEGDYKVKCVRNKRKSKSNKASLEADSRRKMSSGSTLRSLLRRASAQNPSRESIHSMHRTSSEEEAPNSTSVISSIPELTTIYPSPPPERIEPMYGDPQTDSGEEVRFMVEICRLKNLPGIYIVDISRLRGNVWAYKFLYQKLLEMLDLKAKGEILPTFTKQPSQPDTKNQPATTPTEAS
ncbi:hypothetical protein INT44_001808 [Umbelopsis vinacea]|uniref:non-specific serine/threonine protein kinase n=1 Tax=Umbelopsis vinacea TaxID=44442 RepID=A0A8H7UD77_9FUNG|nr:hypothetical protein INT44_001808 [Umbelopsis vinacea]